MMVAIGIIAILGAVIVPGVKKAYSDFKIKETYALLDTLFSAERSFYLICNEVHGYPSGPWGSVQEEILPFFPPQLMKFVRNFSGSTSHGHRWRRFDLYKGLYLVYTGKEVYTHFASGVAFHINPDRVGLTDEDFASRVYYMDDLVNRYKNKGYDVQYDGREYNFRLPEHIGSETRWFR